MLKLAKTGDSDRPTSTRQIRDGHSGFVVPAGPPSDLFLFWPGTPEPSRDRALLSGKGFFQNYPKLAQTRVSAERLNMADAQTSFYIESLRFTARPRSRAGTSFVSFPPSTFNITAFM